jgi:hypothetical protein
VKFAVLLWISTFLNFVSNAENTSVSISAEKKMVAQNLIPVILGIIIVPLVWMICFFAGIAASTRQEEAAFPFSIISVRNAGEKAKLSAMRIARVCYGKGS